MQTYFTHTLKMGQEKIFAHEPGGYLAIVDLDSYQSFAGREADHLDMMAHLQEQMSALTAVAWGVPDEMLNIRLLLTEDHCALERMIESGHSASASGWVRTNGHLCFTSRERLYDCAHHRTRSLLGRARLPKNSRPRVLNVPPGIYSAHIFHHFPFPERDLAGTPLDARSKIHDTVILRRYAFPAPRMAPVRLPGFMPQQA